jgi:ribosomal protein S12 methylthiotransferase accessory factor YcaO
VATITDITPDYVFYAEKYHGRAAEEDFTAALTDAVYEVSARLRDDVVLDEDTSERAKFAVCAIVDALARPARTAYTAGKTSETFTAPPFSLSAEAAVKRYLGGLRVLKGGRWL